MKTLLCGFAVLFAAGSAHGQAPRAGAHAKPARHGAASEAAPKSGMPIDNWFTLDAAVAPSLIRKLDVAPPPKEGSEEITVYGRRRRNGDADWREQLRDQGPVYEAGHSVSAQPLYGGQAVWDSPEQEHVMSDAKDAMGLCGALGGLITCPDKSP